MVAVLHVACIPCLWLTEVAICPSAFTTCKFTSALIFRPNYLKTLRRSFPVLSAKRADLGLYRDDSFAIIKNRFNITQLRSVTVTVA